MTTTYHITRTAAGHAYGHDTRHCDSSGCAGDELRLGPEGYFHETEDGDWFHAPPVTHWGTPRSCQGQTVARSYGWADGVLWERTADAAARTVEYERLGVSLDSDYDDADGEAYPPVPGVDYEAE